MSFTFTKIPECDWNLPDYEAIDAVDQVESLALKSSSADTVVGYIYRTSPSRRWMAHIINPPDPKLAEYNPSCPQKHKRNGTYGAFLSGWFWRKKDAVEWLEACDLAYKTDEDTRLTIRGKITKIIEATQPISSWTTIANRDVLRKWTTNKLELQVNEEKVRCVLETFTVVIDSSIDGVGKGDVLRLYLSYCTCDLSHVTQADVHNLAKKLRLGNPDDFSF